MQPVIIYGHVQFAFGQFLLNTPERVSCVQERGGGGGKLQQAVHVPISGFSL